MQLAQLASRIRDEAHLNEIIRDTRPGFQSAVRSQLAPYLRFTLAEDAPQPLMEEQCP